MLMHKGFSSRAGRALIMATVAAFTVTTFQASPVQAAEAKVMPVSAEKSVAGSDSTDFSSQRRRRGGGGAGGAAALAAFGLVAGSIAAAAATRDRYDYYDGGPVYYGGGPAYYSPGYGYGGSGYYRGGQQYNYEVGPTKHGGPTYYGY